MSSQLFGRKALAAAAAVALLAAGCSGSDSDSASGSGDGGTDAGEGTLTFAGPSGSLGDVYRAAIADFTTETGIEVDYVEGRVADNFARIQADLAANKETVDVYWSNDSIDPIGRAQDTFQPLDPDLLPNAADLVDVAVPDDHIGVTVQIGVAGLVYNTEVFQERGWEPPTSWEALVNSEYDCILYTEPTTAVGLRAQLMLNYVTSGGDYLAIDTALDRLEAARGSVAEVGSSVVEVIDSIASGRTCIGAANQGRALEVKAGGAPIEFVMPTEGVPFNEVTLQLITGSKNTEAAHELIDWLIDVPAQTGIYTDGFFTPTNVNVERATDGVATEVVLSEDLEKTELHFVTPEVIEQSEQWTRAFQAMDITNS